MVVTVLRYQIWRIIALHIEFIEYLLTQIDLVVSLPHIKIRFHHLHSGCLLLSLDDIYLLGWEVTSKNSWQKQNSRWPTTQLDYNAEKIQIKASHTPSHISFSCYKKSVNVLVIKAEVNWNSTTYSKKKQKRSNQVII